MNRRAVEPEEKINSAIGALVFCLELTRLIENREISPDSFRSPESSSPAQGVTVNPMRFTEDELRVHAFNMMIMIVGSTTIAVDSALDDSFGKMNKKSKSEIAQIHAVIHQVRNCFAHNPLNPVWQINPNYQRVYAVRLPNGNQRSVDLSNLDGEPFKLDDIGGLNILIGICMTALEAASGRQTNT